MAFESGFAALSGTARVVSKRRGNVSRPAAVESRLTGRTGAGVGAAGGRTGGGRGRGGGGSPLRAGPLACGWGKSIGWGEENGRGGGRGREEISVGGASLKKKKKNK